VGGVSRTDRTLRLPPGATAIDLALSKRQVLLGEREDTIRSKRFLEK
jgi:hypothetical protein